MKSTVSRLRPGQVWPIRSLRAYMAVKLGEDGEDVLGQMRQSVAEIEKQQGYSC